MGRTASDSSRRKQSSASLRRMTWNTAVLLLNGPLRDPSEVRRLARGGAALICADGGAVHAAAMGLKPRLVIGDMDSLPKKRPRWKGTVFLCDFDRNASDFEKALRFAVQRGLRRVWVAGATGGRFDHELVNLALIETYSAALDLSLIGGSRILGPGRHRINCRRGERITLLPASPQAKVTTAGLRYPLSAQVLGRTSRGLSNEALRSSVRLRVHSGRLWVLF